MAEQIAVWGTDREAAEIYYKLERDGSGVAVFFDNAVAEDTRFLDRPVRKPTAENTAGYFIYIACKSHVYRAIADQLESYGRREMTDYIWYGLYWKKIVLLHGNCHMTLLRKLLLSTKDFVGGGYGLYPNPMIYENSRGYIDDNVLQACDVLIQQDIRRDNACGYRLSAEYLSERVNPDALQITIPNLHPNLGGMFFPLHAGNPDNAHLRKNRVNKNGMFPRAITVIDDMLAQGMTEQDIVERLNDSELLPEEQIIRQFQEGIDKIRQREQKCDVKTADFILRHYRERQMFYDGGHPASCVIKEMWRQICQLMGIRAELSAPVDMELDSYEEPILPCVKKALGLQYGAGYIRHWEDTCYSLDQPMDLAEYVREYLWWKKKTIAERQWKGEQL